MVRLETPTSSASCCWVSLAFSLDSLILSEKVIINPSVTFLFVTSSTSLQLLTIIHLTVIIHTAKDEIDEGIIGLYVHTLPASIVYNEVLSKKKDEVWGCE